MADVNAKDATEQAGSLVRTVGDTVGRKAEEIADQGRKAGADAASGVGRAAGKLADSLEDEAPAVAGYVRGAGEQATRVADDLREKTVGELLDSAVEFGRSKPLLMATGAAIIGFALARLLKAGVADDAHARDGRRAR